MIWYNCTPNLIYHTIILQIFLFSAIKNYKQRISLIRTIILYALKILVFTTDFKVLNLTNKLQSLLFFTDYFYRYKYNFVLIIRNLKFLTKITILCSWNMELNNDVFD